MVSIIIPVYNYERFLDRCMESLVGQTYEDIEIVLVNDGSKDGSLAVSRQWEARDKRVIVVDQPNSGVSAARNAGLDRVRGEYIAFVDADDYVEKTMYEKLVGVARERGADLVFCRYEKFDEHGEVTRIDERAELLGLEQKNVAPFVYNGDKDLIGGFVWRSLFSAALVKNGRFPLDQAINGVAVGEDVIFLLNAILRARKVCFLNERLYHYYRPATWSAKYVLNDSYSLCMRRYVLALQNVLHAFGEDDLAASQNFYAYDIVASQYIAFRSNYRRDLKRLLKTDEFYRKATERENLDAYRKIYRPDSLKKKIRFFLLRHHMFTAYKLMRKFA